MRSYDEALLALTQKGAPFELEQVEIRGQEMKDYVQRPRSLRAVARMAAEWGDREFLVQGERSESYRNVFASAERIASALTSRFGPLKGERIAILGANSIDWSIAFWAGMGAGAIVAAINAWWKADEILHGLNDCGARILIVDRQRLARIEHRLSEIRSLAGVLVIGDAHPSITRENLAMLDDIVADAPSAFPAPPVSEDDPACIFYTSGSTGRSKGAVITHRSWIAAWMNLSFATAAAGLQKGAPGLTTPEVRRDVTLATMPLFHVGGCHSALISAAAAGARVVFPVGRFDPATIMALIEREQVTRWSAVPTMLWRMHGDPARQRHDLKSVKSIGYGGSPSSPELAHVVREIFPNARSVSNGYGLTESGTIFTMIGAEDIKDRPGSVGRPFPTAEVCIRDPSGAALPAGATGEITVRGPMLMRGYWGEGASSAIVDGWLWTGDIGKLDEQGFLYVTDRAKDMIIRGGENIYPAEIEMRLEAHPDILEAAVIGAPHPQLGEEVRAIVRLRPGSTLSASDVQLWVKESLADFKAPSFVDFRDDPLPRNATGKLMKTLLRAGAVSRFEEML